MPVDVLDMTITDADTAHALISELYCPEQPLAFSRLTAPFTCHLRSATAGDVGADRMRISAGLRVAVAPLDYFMTVTPVRGQARYAAGREEIAMRPGVVVRYPTDATLAASSEDIDSTLLRLPLSLVERVAEERLGFPGADLRFDGMSPVSEPMRRTWLGLVRFVHQQLADPGTAVTEPLVLAPLAELVAATALAAFPNTTMTSGYQPDPGPVAPAVVRRAVAFIDAHASLPISVSDVARAAGVGPRALQLAFQKHLGCSPMAYARRVRLECAHRELQAADPTTGDTVAAIAARWGFAKPDRFTVTYRAAYGVLPSHTLRT